MTTTHQTATLLSAAGVSTIPVRLCDDPALDKRPLVHTWKKYQTQVPTQSELSRFFRNGAHIAAITGRLQCIDLDCKVRAGLWDQFVRRVAEFDAIDILARVVIQKTKNDGRHLVFFCDAALDNTKLAWDQSTKRAIIETRGRGGYFVIAPSAGYEIAQGALDNIPTLSETDRDRLLAVCRSFDEAPRECSGPRGDSTDTPGELYDRDTPAFFGLLHRHGWRPAHGKYWTRPGKSAGVSASWDVVPGRFFVFSTSTTLESGHVYRPWHVYAALEHDSDYSAAAKALRAAGYAPKGNAASDFRAGVADNAQRDDHPEPTRENATTRNQDAHRKDFDLPPILSSDEEEDQDWPTPPELIKGLLYRGAKMMIAGASKARKTYLLADLALSVGTGRPWLGITTTQAPVLYLNFELQQFAARDRRRKICAAKFGTTDTADGVWWWHLRGALSRRDVPKMAVYYEIVRRARELCEMEGVGLIIVDPVYKLMQLCGEENKAEDVGRLLNELDALTVETGAAVAFVHHFAKGNAAGKESIDRASGSGVWAREPDALVQLTNHEEDDCLVFDAHLRNFAPIEPFGIRWAGCTWERDILIDPEAIRGKKPNKGGRPAGSSSMFSSFADALAEHRGVLNRDNVTAISQQLKISERTAWRFWKKHNR